MSDPTIVTIYYGPLAWFDKQLGDGDRDYLIDLVNERDEARRRVIHVVEGQEAAQQSEEYERPKRLVAESNDYASIQEHAIMNFIGLVRLINPEELYLHNPPAHVHVQLERELETKVVRFEYPSITTETLRQFNDGFSRHLVGQAEVKESLLSALYRLATQPLTKPAVLMFYGPSGVGKTETAQFINGLLGGTLLRKQFSMYQNDRFASYLFGGSHTEASFAHDLLDRESGVVLIDEFDKANPVFHSAFYQLFDSGVFEDKNYRVQLGNSLVLCTSNYRSENEIREVLGDALFSRFDSLIRFNALSEAEVKQVIDRLVERRFGELSPYERDLVDRDNVRSALYPHANKYGNVRKLDKVVNELISLILVRALLGAEAADGLGGA